MDKAVETTARVTLGDYDAPSAFTSNRSPIILPKLTNKGFTIDPQITALVKENQFIGAASQHPMDHLELFEDICSTTGAEGVPDEYVRCKLFRFSLAEKALKWFKRLPAGSLATWDDVKAAFLEQFYTSARSNQLRNKIAGFQQGQQESFYEAVERFRDYTRDCPHHGFNDISLLNIFFRGIREKFQNILNSASRGNFMTNTVKEATELIDNVAASNAGCAPCYEREVHGIDDQRLEKVFEKTSGTFFKKRMPKFADLDAMQEEEQEEDCNYVGGNYMQGFQHHKPFANSNVYSSKPGLNHGRSYGNDAYQAPPPQENKMEAMLAQLLEGQQKLAATFSGRIDDVYQELNGKFEQLASHMKSMDMQIAQVAEAAKRQEDSLQAKTCQNARKFANTFSMGSAEAEVDALEEMLRNDGDKSEQKLVEESANPAVNQPGVERHPTGNQTQSSSSSSNSKAQSDIPTPDHHASKSEKEREKEIEARRQAILRQVIKESPSHGFIKNSPVVKSFIKQLSESKVAIEEGVQKVLKEVNAMNAQLMKIAKKEPTPPTLKQLDKMDCPGRFVFDCSINDLKLKDALCDTGATVNVMSQKIAQRLGLTFLPTAMTPITLADCSSVSAQGFVSNVMLTIGDCLVPADFYVLDINEAINSPMILGLPFLATVGAVMDLPNQRVSFSKINKTVFYHIRPVGGTSCTTILQIEKKNSAPKVIPQVVQSASKATPKGDTPSTAKHKASSKRFAKLSIVLPAELKNMDDDTISDKLQGTMSLFPHVAHWQVCDKVLVARGRYGRYLFDPP